MASRDREVEAVTQPVDTNRGFRLAWAALAALAIVAGCSDTEDYETRLLKRPLGLAVTCSDAASQPVDLSRCDEDDVVRTGWVLDGDAGGLAVLNLDNGRHFDADPFRPGYNAIPVGGVPLAVRGSDDSRSVYVAVARDDATGGNALVRFDAADLAGAAEAAARQFFPCEIVDFRPGRAAFPGQPDGVDAILVLGACPEGGRLVAVDAAAFGELAEGDFATTPSWPVPGDVLAFGLDATGSVAYVASILRADDADDAIPAGDLLTRLDLLAVDGTAGARKTVVLDDPRSEESVAPWGGGPGTCVASDAVGVAPSRTSRFRGAPAISPDGDLVYVPMGRPAGIAVFDGELERIDVNAPVPGVEGSGNALLAHLGFPDVPLDTPALSIAFVPSEDGLRAVATTESGDVVRIVARTDDDDPVAHVVDADEDQGGSIASTPETRFQGVWVASAYLTRPDLASFGSAEIVTLTDREDAYNFYGIEFHGDTRLERSETWTVTYEGVIPGTQRCGTVVPDESGTWLVDASAGGFCGLGVAIGDRVVLRPDLAVACEGLTGAILEYRVAEVGDDRLALAPAFASLPLPPAGCLDGPIPYEVRVGGQWAVVGSRSGFLHAQALVDGACTTAADADPRFTARATSPVPRDPSGRVTACPIREGDPEFPAQSWTSSLFANPVFELRVVPGCRLGASFLPEVVPPVRDTALMFRVSSGFVPRQVALSGLPGPGLVVTGDSLFVTDAAFGLVYEVDLVEMSTVSSRY
jgi:hypothetical protein